MRCVSGSRYLGSLNFFGFRNTLKILGKTGYGEITFAWVGPCVRCFQCVFDCRVKITLSVLILKSIVDYVG